MKLKTTWGELAAAAGGTLAHGHAEDALDSVSTDSRVLARDEAFWALKGQRHDAHAFLSPALAEQAGGWVVEKGRLGGFKPKHAVEVADTLKALHAFAAWHRRRFDIPVVGITGSNGKTTTKEMLARVLALKGSACVSPGNWNNQVGVPLSVLELCAEHRHAVFELADSKPGDIAEVAGVAQPTVGVITNIGPDHMEFYGTLENNFKTKAELIEALPQDGLAVLNADDPWLSKLIPRLKDRAVTFGESASCRVRLTAAPAFIIDGRPISIGVKAIGRLSYYNAAAAAAAALAVGVDCETIKRGLESYTPAMMRLELLTHPSGATVVLDAYNANPASMKASIEAFVETYAGRELVLALGDMKELGLSSREFHRQLGAWLAGLPLKAVFLAGPEMLAAAKALSAAKPRFPVSHADEPAAWTAALGALLGPRCALFVKASRAMRLETVTKALSCSTP